MLPAVYKTTLRHAWDENFRNNLAKKKYKINAHQLTVYGYFLYAVVNTSMSWKKRQAIHPDSSFDLSQYKIPTVNSKRGDPC